MSKTKAQLAQDQEDIELARRNLLDYLGHPGAEIRCVVQHVNRAGDSRVILPLVAVMDASGHPVILDITWEVSKLLGRGSHPKIRGVVCGGGGMDMCFDLVYSVSAALFGHDDQGGYKIKSHPVG